MSKILCHSFTIFAISYIKNILSLYYILLYILTIYVHIAIVFCIEEENFCDIKIMFLLFYNRRSRLLRFIKVK